MELLTDKHLPMSSWAEADRPRDKLVTKGRHILTDGELISILIGSGTREESAVGLSKRILASCNNNLNELSKLTLVDLKRFKGIGEAKATCIMAAIELGRRRKESTAVKRDKVITSGDAYLIFKPMLMDLPHEEFWVLFLNRSNHILKMEMISRGGVAGTVVDSKIIFKVAVETLCSSLILSHNHPSGNLKPSDQDVQLTKKLRDAGKLLEIPVLDHIIVAESGYYSFADEGML